MSDCTTCAYYRQHHKQRCAFGHPGQCTGDWMQRDLTNADTDAMLTETASILREIARQLDMEATTHDALTYHYLTRCEVLMSEMARRVQIATYRAAKRAKNAA